MNKDLDFLKRPDTIVVTNAATLKEAFLMWQAELEQKRTEEETMLTSDAVCQRLNITPSTLWRWNNTGYLTAHKQGKRNVYRLSDIKRIEQGRDDDILD